MIVSHRHKLIFVKTMRTGSSSVEQALAQICGPDDIITPTRSGIAHLRGQRQAQNYRIDHPAVPKRALWRRLLRRPERHSHATLGFHEHLEAAQARIYLGEEIWNSYFKFTFERNPWDREVSWYYYKSVRKGRQLDFPAFLAKKRIAYIPNYDLYTENGKVIVDFVGQYESLAEGFAAALRRAGVKEQVDLPHVNESKHPGNYRSHYDENTKAIVARWYEREIREFGYEF